MHDFLTYVYILLVVVSSVFVVVSFMPRVVLSIVTTFREVFKGFVKWK